MNSNTNIAITFEAQCCNSKQPEIQWNWRDYHHKQTLFKTSTAEFDIDLDNGPHIIRFELINKTNKDTTEDQDLAVIIKNIAINGISDPKILLASTYRPDYPEPWYSQQDPKPKPLLHGLSYLGWNGIWELEFSVPEYQRLHKTLDLGQQY